MKISSFKELVVGDKIRRDFWPSSAHYEIEDINFIDGTLRLTYREYGYADISFNFEFWVFTPIDTWEFHERASISLKSVEGLKEYEDLFV